MEKAVPVTGWNGASGAFGAAGRAMNKVYGTDEDRGFVRKKAQDLAWTAVVIVLGIVALVDRLYDRNVPIINSGAALDKVFTDESLAGGYKKKYMRCLSRLTALSSPE